MKVALVAPDWGNSWIPLIKAEVERRGHDFIVIHPTHMPPSDVDVYIRAWADGQPIKHTAGTRNVMFLRRYELFNGCLTKIMWPAVDDLILVNSWIKKEVDQYFKERGIQTRTHLIYNAADPTAWTYKPRTANHRIGMACHVHPKKNLPLAMQILGHDDLPPHFELHIAGAVQDSCTLEYLNFMGKRLRRKVHIYGEIPRAQLNFWWDQMGFCLSTSISEGNPNNVLEAMAKGIKPLVHSWPGADDQFPEHCIFETAELCVDMINARNTAVHPYDSAWYRQIVEERYSLGNIRQAVDIALQEGAKPKEVIEK
jgi:glycosyltransferase involved in cell wall biosynthesis